MFRPRSRASRTTGDMRGSRAPRSGYAVAAFALIATASLGACAAGPATSGAGAASTTATSAAPTSAATPSTAKTAATKPSVHGYSFAPGMIKVAGQQVFTPINGILAMPSTPGPHPVAVIVHGSYPSCIDASTDKVFTKPINTVSWPEGCVPQGKDYSHGLTIGPDYVRATASFGYLAQELASRGIATIAVDVNTKERGAWSFDSPHYELQTEIVKTHLDLLKRLNEGDSLGLPWGDAAKGTFDLSSIAVIGHSTGGWYAAESAFRAPFPGIKAAVALQPGSGVIDKPTKTLAPTLIVTGQCDEQVKEDGLKVAKEVSKKYPSGVVITASMAGTTHIGLLSGGGSHRVGPVTPVETAGCKDTALLGAEQRLGTVSLLTADFLTAALKGGATAYELGTAKGATVTFTSWTPAATVKGVEKAAPQALPASSITFDTSSVVVVPAKPKSMDIGAHMEDYERSAA